MPMYKYILVALLGSTGVASPCAALTQPGPTLGVDAIAQPNGGALFAGALPKNSQRVLRKETAKRRHRGGKHVGGTKYGPDCDAGSKDAAKSRVKPNALTVKQSYK